MSNRVLSAIAAAFLSLALYSPHSQAQTILEQLSPDDRQKALQAIAGGQAETSDAPPPANIRVSTDNEGRRLAAQQAAQDVTLKADGQLPLFGYALFSGAGNGFQPSAEVPVPQNYVLGPGDLVRVQLFGNQNETLNLSVTREGSINFPKLGPIQVAGLSMDDVRTVIDRRVAKELIGVQTNITLGPLRGVQIFLLGDARQPGAYSVSGLATITNALMAGGGVSSTGSLRKIELKRAGRLVQRLDLYDFLLRGDSSRDMRLQAGDAVFIPPVGPRVAISGAVTRPAVYEMSGALTVKGALDLAGGLAGDARRGQVTLERIGSDGARQLRSLDVRDAQVQVLQLKDGDRLEVNAIYASAENPVSVIGHVRYEKRFAWNPQLTVGKVLALAEVRPSEPGRELYPVMALIERTDAATGLRQWRGFDLAALLSEGVDEPVSALDRIVVLTRSDIAFLQTPEVRDALAANGRAGASCPALLEVVKMSDSTRANSIRILLEGLVSAAEGSFKQAAADGPGSFQPCPKVFLEAPTALTYLLEHSAGIVGEVRLPGIYPFVAGTPIKRLTAIAGGETAEAAQSEVEFFDAGESIAGGLPRFRRVPRDAAFAQQAAQKAIYKFLPAAALPEVGAVNVRGEVRFPGRYVITRGERYSDLIARAGGMNDYAFAYGTVFTRASARAQESAGNRRAATDLRESLFSASTQGVSAATSNAASSAVVLDLVQRLESAPAVGRVVIEADPSVINVRPGSDFLLEAGDEIYVPKRPNSVAVIGQVLSGGSLAFSSSARPEDYIREAGGYTDAADKKRMFLVLPNGAARPLKRSFWQGGGESIPPGSVIVVPRDVAPVNALLLTERITSILSNLALSAAALVTINR